MPAGNRLAAPVKIPPRGLALRVDARHATAESKDPTPSCLAGKRATGTVWYKLPAAPTGRLLDVTVTSRSRAVVVAAFAVVPWAGTELACLKAVGGGTVHLRNVLAPNLRYYVMVGSADTTVGDLHTVKIRAAISRWSATTPIQARRQGVAAAADDTSVYAFGGFQTSMVTGGPAPFHSADISRFDMAKHAWSVVGTLPVGLSYARAVRLGSTIYLPGGRSNLVNGAGCIVKTQYAFNTATNAVTTVAEQPGYYTYDYGADADAARGIYYMAGGAYDPTPCDAGASVDDTTVTNVVKSYNPSTNAWTTLPPDAHRPSWRRDGRGRWLAVRDWGARCEQPRPRNGRDFQPGDRHLVQRDAAARGNLWRRRRARTRPQRARRDHRCRRLVEQSRRHRPDPGL